MAINLNKSEPKPEFDTKEAVEKYLPLIIEHAPMYDEFVYRELYKEIGIYRKSEEYKIYNRVSDKIITALKSEGKIEHIPNTNRYVLTDYGRKEKRGENKKEKERQELKDEIDRLTSINLKLRNKQLKRYIVYSVISFILGILSSNAKDILAILKTHIPK